MPNNLDFSGYEEQRSFEVISPGTIVLVQLTIKPGGVGPDNLGTPTKNGDAVLLACEFVVVEGNYAKRKFWDRFMIESDGSNPNHAETIRIAGGVLKAILLSVRGIKPKRPPQQYSDAEKLALQVKGYAEFDGLRFHARLGVEQGNGYAAKNKIVEVITPENKFWRKVDQVDPDLLGRAANTAMVSPEPSQSDAQASSPAANKIERPDWAK
jgi:hypothetical protein